jgi:ABC-type lipoprotein export system ATPase subunit
MKWQSRSGGNDPYEREQQRVDIARALVNIPATILVDESRKNLDPWNSTFILELIQKLNKDLNQTMVMFSHEGWNQKYLNRVFVIQDGQMVSGGE